MNKHVQGVFERGTEGQRPTGGDRNVKFTSPDQFSLEVEYNREAIETKDTGSAATHYDGNTVRMPQYSGDRRTESDRSVEDDNVDAAIYFCLGLLAASGKLGETCDK